MAETNKGDIRNWWADAPMTYAATHGSTAYRRPDGSYEEVAIGSRRFYELADEVFLSWNTPLHGPEGAFSNIFPFETMRGKKVLEAGCGMGFMAMQWAIRGANMHAVDLNPVAVANTKHRFETFSLSGIIQEADAENLPFASGEFDYAYSWGVLHHTPGTKRAIEELRRVLKPGAQAGVMLYNRHSFLAQYVNRFTEGFVNLESRFLTPLELQCRYGDGHRAEGNCHTWPVTAREVYTDLFRQFSKVSVKLLGTDIDSILWHWFPDFLPKFPLAWRKALARRWGWSLWITAVK
jgi:ubiquinone/menaquinone biosynthesis C-methylase UbiE